MTYTYALMPVSAPVYDEIAAKMREAGYDHVFGPNGEIDMHGIALVRAETAQMIEARRKELATLHLT